MNLLFTNFLVKRTGCSDLQLKPWISLDKQILANAIVEAVAASVCKPNIKQAAAATAIIRPSVITFIIKDLVKIDSFMGRGFSFITSFEWGSRPRAIAGKESVRRFINRRCTAAKGTGKARSDAKSTTRIAAVLPDSKN